MTGNNSNISEPFMTIFRSLALRHRIFKESLVDTSTRKTSCAILFSILVLESSYQGFTAVTWLALSSHRQTSPWVGRGPLGAFVCGVGMFFSLGTLLSIQSTKHVFTVNRCITVDPNSRCVFDTVFAVWLNGGLLLVNAGFAHSSTHCALSTSYKRNDVNVVDKWI